MRITIIGAGAIGSAIASFLVRQPEVTQVQVCDARARNLQELHNRLQTNRLRSFQIDARDYGVLEPILQGSQVVISAAPPQLNPALARLCLKLGVNFCDMGGNDQIVRQELNLHEQARQRAIWIVPNCGLAPGLVNILCLHGIDQFDEVEAAYLRVGDVPQNPHPFNFRISWSAEKAIADYTNLVQLIRNGQLATVEPLTGMERIRFEAPFGEMEAFYTAGGLSTLTEQLAGHIQVLDYKSIRWPCHASQMRFVLGLGFGESRSIDVRTHLTYRDVLVRRMRQRLGGHYEDAVLLRVAVHGKKDRQPYTLLYEMIDRYDQEQQLSAMRRCTAMPTALVALMIATGEVKGGGALPPEQVVPRDRFYQHLTEHGLPITYRWYEGYVDVTYPDPARALAHTPTLEKKSRKHPAPSSQ